jgi:hypothetical protein
VPGTGKSAGGVAKASGRQLSIRNLFRPQSIRSPYFFYTSLMNRTQVTLAFLGILASTTMVRGSIVGTWRFDEPAGTISVDQSGNGNDVALHGGAIFTNDIPVSPVPRTRETNSGSMRLNGTSAYGLVGPSADLQIAQQITIEAWIRRDVDNGLSDVGIAGMQYGTDTRNAFNLFLRNGQTSIGFEVTNVDGVTGTAEVFNMPLAIGQWFHVAGVYDGSSVQLFVEGTLAASQGFSGEIGYTRSNSLLIGADNEGVPFSPTWFFPGTIDEVRIHDAALEPQQFLNATVPEPASLATWTILAVSATMFFRKRRVRGAGRDLRVVHFCSLARDQSTWQTA